MIAELERLSAAWTQMSEVLSVPHTEAEYRRVSAFLDIVVDEVGEDDSHPLAALMETLGALVDAYEREHVAEPAGSPVQVLRMLMDDHGLSQADLPDGLPEDRLAHRTIHKPGQVALLPPVRAK